MVRSAFVLLLCLSVIAGLGADDPGEANAAIKKQFPAVPEENGLRLEVDADLNHRYGSNDTGMVWNSASLTVEVALHNVSSEPITVATTGYGARPHVLELPGMERIVLTVQSSTFRGKPTAFVSAQFTPVTLLPGEYVLLLKHHAHIKDRRRADAIKEVAVYFRMSRDFTGPKEWWRGQLLTYAPIVQEEPDEYIARSNAAIARYAAEKEAEKDPNYGATNAARVAALIASADEVSIRGEGNEMKGEVIVRDPKWIRQVSEAIAATRLPQSSHCFCTGWRTAYFRMNGEPVISAAAIHGNQLRIHWNDEGGDYKISEADWKTVKQALEIPGTP